MGDWIQGWQEREYREAGLCVVCGAKPNTGGGFKWADGVSSHGHMVPVGGLGELLFDKLPVFLRIQGDGGNAGFTCSYRCGDEYNLRRGLPIFPRRH